MLVPDSSELFESEAAVTIDNVMLYVMAALDPLTSPCRAQN